MPKKKLKQYIPEMKKLSESLIPYTYPHVDFDEESQVLPLKCRTVMLDGYEMVLNYSVADYHKHITESLQIQSVYTPFLPFNVVCKLAVVFLGTKYLSYIDFFRSDKKIYCWTLKKRKGKPISPGKRLKRRTYEGLEYYLLNPGTVSLYESELGDSAF